ncbi:MAG TPA: hypothetical protein VKA95_14300 [Nitrososphaeraceae archaeon]|nr:hypothetical protein [Nitrososphaeraceae archaeon]
MRIEVGSIGKPHIGRNGIGNSIISQIPTRKAIIFLDPFFYANEARSKLNGIRTTED